MNGFDMPGDDAGWDAFDADADSGSDLLPDYPDAWDVPEPDIPEDVIASYGHVFTSTDSFSSRMQRTLASVSLTTS